eukprot:TRINITY_DN40463_c0_g1_i1.p1 TRINITY_DN40463_c0_g1~~TRINITY_DN40463_c0_g1_i1.p1  ORF type:complete len:543 (-),score=86.63 TRINITY_DN40463_c0_g1_i1:1852-3480(-)
MSSSFPTSWEPYGSSQQNAALAWRRPATLPSQQPPPLSTRWQSTQDATQASPLPSLDPNQRVAPDISAFQANDREQKAVARFESLREEMQQVTAQLRQLNANIENLRTSQGQPFPALIAEVGRLSQLIGELMQRPAVPGHQSNLEFAIASSEKRITDTVLAITDVATSVQTSCAAIIPRLDSGLGSVERLIHAATSSVAADVPKWFELAFQQMATHHIMPMLSQSEARVKAQFEHSCANMITDIEKHVSMAVGNGVSQVLNRISLEQTLGAQPPPVFHPQTGVNLFSASDVGDTEPKSKPKATGMPSKDADVKQFSKNVAVAASEKNAGLTDSQNLPINPSAAKQEGGSKDVLFVDDKKVPPETAKPVEASVQSDTRKLLNGSATNNLIMGSERKPGLQAEAHDGDSLPNPNMGAKEAPMRKKEDSAVEELDIFAESEVQGKGKCSKSKEKEEGQHRNGKQGVRQARQRKQDYTEPNADSGTESSESKDPSEEDGEEESEWECDESGSDSSGGSHGGEGFHRPGSKRMKRSFVRRSKRQRQT